MRNRYEDNEKPLKKKKNIIEPTNMFHFYYFQNCLECLNSL